MTDLVDTRTIAGKLGMSVSSVNNLRREGRIPYYTIPGRGNRPVCRYSISEVEDWLRSLRQAPVEQVESGTRFGTRRGQKKGVLSQRYF